MKGARHGTHQGERSGKNRAGHKSEEARQASLGGRNRERDVKTARKHGKEKQRNRCKHSRHEVSTINCAPEPRAAWPTDGPPTCQDSVAVLNSGDQVIDVHV